MSYHNILYSRDSSKTKREGAGEKSWDFIACEALKEDRALGFQHHNGGL